MFNSDYSVSHSEIMRENYNFLPFLPQLCSFKIYEDALHIFFLARSRSSEQYIRLLNRTIVTQDGEALNAVLFPNLLISCKPIMIRASLLPIGQYQEAL